MDLNIVNNGKPYFFRFDVAKEAGEIARITDYLKTRVSDNGKKVPIKWFDQGQAMDVHGMSPFIQGGVGHYIKDDNGEILPSSDVVYREWYGTPADVTDDGVVYYTLEDQFFCKQGEFNGFFGLRDSQGNVLTSVNIVFQILGSDLRITKAKEFYISELENLKTKFKIQTQDAINEARDTYNKETQATRDALKAKDAEVEATRAEQRILGNQLDTYKDQIKRNEIVRRSEFLTNSEALSASITDRLSKISTNPEVFDNFPQLSAAYPTGKDGLFFVAETKHLYTYANGKWQDRGELPLTGLTNEQKNILDNSIYQYDFIYSTDQLKAPYTDLDLYPANTIICLGIDTSSIIHTPDLQNETFKSGFTVLTYGPSTTGHGDLKDGTVQLLLTSDNELFWRIRWNSNWSQWKAEFYSNQKFFFDSAQIKAPYDDLDTFPANASAVYAVDASKVKNAATNSNAFTIKTWGINGNASQSGTVQLFNSRDKGMYVRTSWGEGPAFTDWKQLKTGTPEENEFEYAKPSLAMFGKFGVVGDSYASGILEDFEHNKKDTFAQMTPEMSENLSWPTMLARKWGTSMLHLAKGGLSTRTWLTDDQGLKKLNESDPQDIYYLCLGINDYYGLGDSYLGIESDMESGADSFYGNYAKIIKAIKTKAPLAKIIMFGITITPGDSHDRQQRFSDAQYKIAQHFGIPYISENDDELFSSDYYTTSMGSGHPSSYLYGAMAEAFERLIQKTIYRNRDYFYSYGWNGEF